MSNKHTPGGEVSSIFTVCCPYCGGYRMEGHVYSDGSVSTFFCFDCDYSCDGSRLFSVIMKKEEIMTKREGFGYKICPDCGHDTLVPQADRDGYDCKWHSCDAKFSGEFIKYMPYWQDVYDFIKRKQGGEPIRKLCSTQEAEPLLDYLRRLADRIEQQQMIIDTIRTATNCPEGKSLCEHVEEEFKDLQDAWKIENERANDWRNKKDNIYQEGWRVGYVNGLADAGTNKEAVMNREKRDDECYEKGYEDGVSDAKKYPASTGCAPHPEDGKLLSSAGHDDGVMSLHAWIKENHPEAFGPRIDPRKDNLKSGMAIKEFYSDALERYFVHGEINPPYLEPLMVPKEIIEQICRTAAAIKKGEKLNKEVDGAPVLIGKETGFRSRMRLDAFCSKKSKKVPVDNDADLAEVLCQDHDPWKERK